MRRKRFQQAGLTATIPPPAEPEAIPREVPPGEPSPGEPEVVSMDEVQAAAIGEEPHYAPPPAAAEPEEEMGQDEVGTADPFTTVYPLEEGDTDALVIRCADPRFRDAFIAFEEDLGIHNPAVLAVTGSVKAFGLQMVIPKEWHALRKQLELIASRHSHVPRVILFTHEDCKSYAESKAKGLLKRFSDVLGAMKDHLVELAKYLKKHYLPNAKFELYHASIVTEKGVRGVKFVKVAEF